MSPIMTFLSEEAYQHLPGEKKESILLTDFPSVPPEWIQPEIQEHFNHWLKIREKTYSQMELMRKQKQIGSSLETQVVLSIPKDFLAQFKSYWATHLMI